MKKSNFALRLQPSLMEEARKIAKDEGVAVNQLINVAVAEKVAALRTEEYFAERAKRGDVPKALRVLKRAGAGNTPVPGDEMPAGPGSHATVDKRSPSIDGQLRFAIANKHLIQFRYHGDRRVAEPHDYGIHNGSPKLLVYQRRRSGSGTGRSRGAQGWRLLDVAKIVECAVLEATFLGSRGEAHHRHYSWDVIYARVG